MTCLSEIVAIAVAGLGLAGAAPEAPYGGRPEGRDSVPLRGTILVEDGVPRAVAMVVVGTKLVLLNVPPAAPVHVRDARTGRLVLEYGEWGVGDHEFLGPYHLDPVPGTETVWVYDMTRHRLALLDVSDAALRGRAPIRRWLVLRTDAALTAPTWVGDTIYSPGFFHGGRIAAFTSDGRFSHVTGAVPAAPPGEPVLATQQAFQSTMRPDPARTRLALATRHAGVLEIYGRDGSKLADARVPDPFAPAYRVAYTPQGTRMTVASDTRYGYVDVGADSARIYALFSGKTDPETGFYPDGRLIHMFDWSGRHVRTLVLEADAAMLAVDPRSGAIYTFNTVPRRQIARYDIGSLEHPDSGGEPPGFP